MVVVNHSIIEKCLEQLLVEELKGYITKTNLKKKERVKMSKTKRYAEDLLGEDWADKLEDIEDGRRRKETR